MNKRQRIFLSAVAFICVLAGVWHFLSEWIGPKLWYDELYIIDMVRFYPPLLAILALMILNIVLPKLFGQSYFKTILTALLFDLLICVCIFIICGGWFGRQDSLNIFTSHFTKLLTISFGVRFIYNRL